MFELIMLFGIPVAYIVGTISYDVAKEAWDWYRNHRKQIERKEK